MNSVFAYFFSEKAREYIEVRDNQGSALIFFLIASGTNRSAGDRNRLLFVLFQDDFAYPSAGCVMHIASTSAKASDLRYHKSAL